MRKKQKQYHISAVVQIKINIHYQETRYNNSHDKYKANIITKSLLSLHMMQNAETVDYKSLSSSYYLFLRLILLFYMYGCMYVHHMHTVSWSWSWRQFWTSM